MNRTLTRLALLTTAAAAALVPAAAAASPAIPYTAPAGNYGVSSNHHTTDVTVTSNPSNYSVRVKINCVEGTYYSGWHQGTGVNFGVACGVTGDIIAEAYVQYDRTHLYTIEYWHGGQPNSGSW